MISRNNQTYSEFSIFFLIIHNLFYQYVVVRRNTSYLHLHEKDAMWKNLRISSLCSNVRTFLSLRFSVKSILVQKLPFSWRLWILIFMNFGSFWSLKFTKFTNLEPLKCQKTADLELQEPPKMVSRKIWVSENSVIFTLWVSRRTS